MNEVESKQEEIKQIFQQAVFKMDDCGKFLGITKLAEELGLDSYTVRTALDKLEEFGHVYQIKSSGTYLYSKRGKPESPFRLDEPSDFDYPTFLDLAEEVFAAALGRKDRRRIDFCDLWFGIDPNDKEDHRIVKLARGLATSVKAKGDPGRIRILLHLPSELDGLITRVAQRTDELPSLDIDEEQPSKRPIDTQTSPEEVRINENALQVHRTFTQVRRLVAEFPSIVEVRLFTGWCSFPSCQTPCLYSCKGMYPIQLDAEQSPADLYGTDIDKPHRSVLKGDFETRWRQANDFDTLQIAESEEKYAMQAVMAYCAVMRERLESVTKMLSPPTVRPS